MNETWKPIYGYEDDYLISSDGRIASLKNNIYMQFRNNGNGYMQVDLCKNGTIECYYVHRLVLYSFLGYSKLPCNHKNAIRHDNRLENLEYVTNRQNQHLIKTDKVLPIGVTKHHSGFRARISIDGKLTQLGTYKTIDEAKSAYDLKLKEVGDGF